MTTRGNGGIEIFADDIDRLRFLAVLRAEFARAGWRCLAWCLMDNHYHLLIETPQANLADGMRRINGGYAAMFNRRHGAKGHLFGDRYHSVHVIRDEHLLEAARYIACNPVRAGLCRRPEEWEWSSHVAALGEELPLGPAVDRLLDFFGSVRAKARALYRAFVADAVPPELLRKAVLRSRWTIPPCPVAPRGPGSRVREFGLAPRWSWLRREFARGAARNSTLPRPPPPTQPQPQRE